MKLRYILYSAVGILLHTSCNDAFLERSPQDLNDNTYWTSTGDLRTYANAFYDILPGGVTNYGDTDADDQCQAVSISFCGDNMLFRQKMDYGLKVIGRIFAI